jgi:hypothetical protein
VIEQRLWYALLVAYRVHDSRRKFGVESGPFCGQRTIDLARLPAGARAALLERITRGKPRPILTRTGAVDRWFAALLVALGGGGTFWVAGLGFGELLADSQLEPGWAIVYAGLGVVVALGVVLFARSVLRDGLLRFPQGTLVYPLDLLQIDGLRVRVRSFGDARFVETEGNALTIEYADGEKVRVRGRRHSEVSLLTEMLAAQHDLEDATAAQRSTQDVLGELRAHFPWSELVATGPATKPPRLLFALPFVLGAMAGVGGWMVRRPLEDDALFRSARAQNVQPAYRRYLALGTRHQAEAREDLADVVHHDAHGTIVELWNVTTEFSGTRAAVAAERDLRAACKRYAADHSRERCAVRRIDGECVWSAREETICADEVKEAELARVGTLTDVPTLFSERTAAVAAGQTDMVDAIDARVDSLVAKADGEVCAVEEPYADVAALNELARRERRMTTLLLEMDDHVGDGSWWGPTPHVRMTDRVVAVAGPPPDVNVVEGGWIARFLAKFASGPVALAWRAGGAPPDRVWSFTLRRGALELRSSSPDGARGIAAERPVWTRKAKIAHVDEARADREDELATADFGFGPPPAHRVGLAALRALSDMSFLADVSREHVRCGAPDLYLWPTRYVLPSR